MPRARDLARNPGWKLGAVALAYLLWLVVVEEPPVIRQLEVPVRFENLNPGLALLRDRPLSVFVRVQASEGVAKQLQPTDVEARVDLGGLGEGTHLVRLPPDSPSLIPRRVGIEISEVFPSALEIHLEPRLTAEVQVRPTLTGRPPDGFEVLEARVEPATVRIEGPQSAVKRTAEARTREVPVEGKRASFQQEVVVDVANPDVTIASGPRARVLVSIAETIGERTFSDIPVAPMGSTYEARLSPRLARITVRGPQKTLGQLSRDDLVAYVDLNGLKPQPDEYALPVLVAFTRDLFRERLAVKARVPETVGVRLLNRRPAAADKAARGG